MGQARGGCGDETFLGVKGIQMFEANDLVRHKKTGGIYRIICAARLEATLEEMIVYRSEATGETWVRSREQMFDGRFEKA